MNSDRDWVEELIGVCEKNTLDKVIEWLGQIIRTDTDHKKDPIYFLKPNNPRIERIIVNTQNEQLDRIGIEGNKFSLTFEFLSGLTDGYKRTFNTYDPIYDEQYMFYPTKKEFPFVAFDSWIPEEEQKKSLETIAFREVNFYFGKNKVPYHYRDGWILEDRQNI
ncbi:hypothetical protein FVR03_10215 [Pontibacter qinzhouensis]|uniref:Uncharacterized protein n=1 Tax=Pontibacter qinzhouensis TaxID=2603253 RepID=A0A5C8K7A8_9BACT|nr:hypothetical protein [Pontibacter qinzhouensis]TXK46794.1 hypothetical protein FVR03_10215 [Pontibacter qinzhouensis]